MPDLAVASPSAGVSGRNRAGKVQVFSSAGGALLSTVEGEANRDWFGRSIDGNLDADGDGRSDLVVGADLYDEPEARDTGRAYVYLLGDSDGDGAGDACDCRPADPGSLPPAGATVQATRTGPVGIRLSWTPVAGADSYSVCGGDVGALAPGDYGACLTEGLTGTVYTDLQAPASGVGLYFLVQPYSFECGLGSLGFDSLETLRVNTDPSPCIGRP